MLQIGIRRSGVHFVCHHTGAGDSRNAKIGVEAAAARLNARVACSWTHCDWTFDPRADICYQSKISHAPVHRSILRLDSRWRLTRREQ